MPPSPPPPSSPFSCTNAVADGRTDSVQDHYNGAEWCSVYSGKGNKEKCLAAFVLYDSANTYQVCKWKAQGQFTCSIDSELYVCDHSPPSLPPPPLEPSPPSLPPPPAAPVLCPVMGLDMVSLRDLDPPTWCHDYNNMKSECESAYVRAGTSYVRCVYTVDGHSDGTTDKCEMDVAGQSSCFLSPPAPPVPPSMPATCASAGLIGLEYDLRDYPTMAGFSEKTTKQFNSGHYEMGFTQYAVCSLFTGEETLCKHAYQTNGLYYQPCLYGLTEPGACTASPMKRAC